MEIVKSFNENNLHTEIIIKGTFDNPLFRASDIGIILDISNINQNIKDYDDTKKILIQHETQGGKQSVTFLTEKGLYNILFASRKPIAEKFKDWICEVIKELRLKGIYELEKIVKDKDIELKTKTEEIEEKENIIIEKQTLLENSKIEKQREIEKAIIKQFPINTECIYIGTIDNSNEVGEKLIKFGHSNELPTRVVCHRKNYNNFVLIEAFRVQNKVEIENLIKTHKIIKKQMRTIIVNEKNKTEIIAYDDAEFTIEKLIKIIKDIIQSKIYSIDNFNNLMKKNEELEDIQRTIDEKFKIQEDKFKNLEEKNKVLELTIKEQNIEIIYLKEKLEEKEKIIDQVDKEEESVYKNVLLPEDELNKKFDEFIKEICIVRPDVEEKSVNIEGRYRLWSQVKPKKEVFHALKNYLDIRFKPKKINGIHSYNGIRLKEVEYKKRDEESDVQRFIFHACQFSDTGKILNSTLLKEYQKWKLSLTKEISDNDIKELKDYLNTSPYALKATVWVDNESNEGYYGIGLKTIGYQPKYVSTTGKKVYKVECKSNLLLSTFDSILNASLQQDISRVAMSRAVKNKTVFNNDYYYTSDISVINNNIE
jgi:prophage antirepressor-like protein